MSYMGASSITLHDGTVISDPANTPATAAQCAPYQCGLDSDNTDARYWCAYWNQSGSFACTDEVCAPFAAENPFCALPQPSNTPIAQLPVLTPENIVQPLPDISATDAPIALMVPSCSFWCDLNEAIDDNPLLAVLILAGATFLLWPKGNRRG